MSWIIPEAVEGSLMVQVETLLKEKGYNIRDTGGRGIWVEAPDIPGSIKVYFEHSWQSGGWHKNNYGWLKCEFRSSEQRRMKITFRWSDQERDRIALSHESFDRAKLFNKVAEMLGWSQRCVEGLREMKREHEANTAEFEKVFPGGEFYGSSGEFEIDGGHVRIARIGTEWRASIEVVTFGTLEELKAIIEDVQKRIGGSGQ